MVVLIVYQPAQFLSETLIRLGGPGLLLGGLTSSLTSSFINLLVYFLIPIKHVDAGGAGLQGIVF